MATKRKSGPTKKAARPKSAAKQPARTAAKSAKPSRTAGKPAAGPASAKVGRKPAPAKATARPAAKPAAKSGVAKLAVKAAAARPMPGKPAAPAKATGKPLPLAKGGKATAGKPLPPGKAGAKGGPAAPARPIKIKLVPAPTPAVRPIGVLPPEAMAKTTNKSPRPAAPARPLPQRPKTTARPVKEAMSDKGLTEADLKHFEQRLLQERARILKEMGHLESTVLKVNPRDSAGELSGYSFHMADAGTDSMEREKAFDIASKEGRLLMEIDAALGRLYRGEYGVCEASGKPISRARLEALPWARYTVEEQEKLEREQRAGRAPQPE